MEEVYMVCLEEMNIGTADVRWGGSYLGRCFKGENENTQRQARCHSAKQQKQQKTNM